MPKDSKPAQRDVSRSRGPYAYLKPTTSSPMKLESDPSPLVQKAAYNKRLIVSLALQVSQSRNSDAKSP